MRAIITVLGKDNMGIIYNVTKIVSSYSVNILDISQTIMNSDIFAMVMLVDTAKMQGEFKELAADLGITKVRVVANKVRSAEDEAFIRERIPEEDLLGFIHYNAEVIDADRNGKSPYDFSAAAVEEIRAIKAKMDAEK